MEPQNLHRGGVYPTNNVQKQKNRVQTQDTQRN